MKTIVKLPDGFECGNEVCKEVELGSLTAGDLFDTEDMATELCSANQQTIAAANSNIVYRELIRRMIKKAGSAPIPLPDVIFRRLTLQDFLTIRRAAETLDEAGVKKAEAWGRDNPAAADTLQGG